MARRRRTRTIGVGLLSVAVVAVVLVVVLLPRGGGLPSATDLLSQAASAAKSASCDSVTTIGPYGGVSDPNSPQFLDRTHIGTTSSVPTPPTLSSYPSVPPTSGPHAPIPPGPLAAGVYDSPPDIYRAIHSLEHGATIIWYDPSTSGKGLDQLKSFYRQKAAQVNVDQSRVLVAPYSYPDQGTAGHLPSGVQMAIVAWHRMQTCGQVSLPVAFDFSSQYSAPPFDHRSYKGEAPEAGAAL